MCDSENGIFVLIFKHDKLLSKNTEEHYAFYLLS